MRLDRFDLNLLVALHALLEERNVSRAADRLNLTQPAMSAALRRLRLAFRDELLVIHGKKMMPTAHALALLPMVQNALATMQALVSSASTFTPATSSRVFRVIASDYVTTVLIAPLLTQLESDAPGIRVDVIAPTPQAIARLEQGTVDFLVTPEEFLSTEHPRKLLFEERHVVVGWNRNPVFSRPLTEEIYLACGHIIVEIGSDPTYVERQMRLRGDKRRIELIAPSFNIVPWLLPGSHRISLMHERLAKAMLPKFPLATARVPFKLPMMREMIQYHSARETDPGMQWLIGRMIASAGKRRASAARSGLARTA